MRRLLVLAAALLIAGCVVPGAMVKLRCEHDDLNIKACLPYMKFTREKATP